MFFGPFVTVIGGLKTESGIKEVSFTVRQNAIGSLNYIDAQRGIALTSARFTSPKRFDQEIALNGTGKLADGTAVTFTVLTNDLQSDTREFSISMSNGYFAAGVLQSMTPGFLLHTGRVYSVQNQSLEDIDVVRSP